VGPNDSNADNVGDPIVRFHGNCSIVPSGSPLLARFQASSSSGRWRSVHGCTSRADEAADDRRPGFRVRVGDYRVLSTITDDVLLVVLAAPSLWHFVAATFRQKPTLHSHFPTICRVSRTDDIRPS
jgi:hypothetical protein